MREEHAREGDTRMRHRSRLVHGGSGTGEGFSGEDDSKRKVQRGRLDPGPEVLGSSDKQEGATDGS